MSGTTGYAAGVDTSAAQMSYGSEAVWGVAPAAQFQGVRIAGETLSHTKTRQRPQEMRGDRQAAAARTTQEQASGAVQFAFSGGTFDEWLACLVGDDWQTAASQIAGVAADITLTTGTNVLSSATAEKFANIRLGSWIRTSGFTNAVNNTVAQVIAKPSNTSITLGNAPAAFVTETPAGTAAKVHYSNLRNGLLFKSLYLQLRLASALWFRWPGSYFTRGMLSASMGQFLSGSFDVLAQQEDPGTADAGTGSILAAPTGRVLDPVNNIKGVYWNGALVPATCMEFGMELMNEGAEATFGFGSALAAGINPGIFTAKGSLKMYFKDFALYDAFRAETEGVFAVKLQDDTGIYYTPSFLNATLLNPKLEIGGPGRPVRATFDIEANPDTASGCTFSIDRL